MNRSLKLVVIMGCIMLILGAFYFGYRITMNRIGNQKPGTNSNAIIDENNNTADEYVSSISFEEKVAPGAILQKKVLSLNSGKVITEYEGKVPNVLVNAVESKVKEYFKEYDSIEFNKDRIVVIKKMQYLPNRYVVKLEGQFVRGYKTDSEGNLANEIIEPYPCKNSDEDLIRGIEVDSEDRIWETIGDYE